jgi:hypothetical protein
LPLVADIGWGQHGQVNAGVGGAGGFVTAGLRYHHRKVLDKDLPEILVGFIGPFLTDGVFACLLVVCISRDSGSFVARGIISCVRLLGCTLRVACGAAGRGRLLGCPSPLVYSRSCVFRSEEGLAGSGDEQDEQQQQDHDRQEPPHRVHLA